MQDQATPIDPYDPASLRIDPQSATQIGTKKLLLHVPVRKPSRHEFFRTHPANEYRVTMAILELKEEREIYAVLPAVESVLPGETRRVALRTCISRAGTVFLWPVPLPVNGRELAWHKTARAAAEQAETVWVRMTANLDAGHYDILVASTMIADPVWPDESFGDLIRIGFANGRLIDTLEHPVIKRLQGQ
jgi:hypothetical protein